MSTPVMNRKERRSWNRMAADAREVFAEVDLDDGTVVKVYIPTAEALQELQAQQRKADFFGAVKTLIGEGPAEQLRAAEPNAPFTAWRDLIFAVMEDLNLGAPPESSAVPSS